MRNFWLRTFLVCGVISSASSQAFGSQINVSSDNQVITVGSGETIIADSENGETAIYNVSFVNTQISVDTGDSSKGIIETGSASGALEFNNGASLGSLTILSGLVTSQGPNAVGTLNFGDISSATIAIIVGKDSGSSATLSNTSADTGSGRVLSFTGSPDIALTVTNKATGIISASEGQVFKLTDYDGGSSLTVSNAGSITAGADQNLFDLSGYDATVSNSGTMTGNINLTNSSSLTLSSGTITGDATIDSTSSLSFGSGASVSGSINSSGGLSFAGTSNSVSALTTSDGSSLSLTLNLNSLGSSAIEVAGAALISSNTTLNLTISGTAVSGTTAVLISGGDGSSISALTISKINGSSTSVLNGQTYTTSVVDNQLILTLTGDSTGGDDEEDDEDEEETVAVPVLTNSNDQSTYDAITSITSATGTLATVQNFLNSASYSSSQKEEVLKSVTVQADNSTNRVAFNNIATTGNIISSRLESVRSNNFATSITDLSFANNLFNQNSSAAVSNLSSKSSLLNPLRDNNLQTSYPSFITIKGDDAAAKSSAWIQTFGSKIAQGNTSSGDGYDANSGGVIIGADHNLTKNFILGVTAGYSKSSISARNAFKTTKIDTYQATIYTGYDAKSYFLNTSLGISLNDYYSDRYISVANVSAKANYSGKSYTARAELGSNYHFPNEILFTPSFAVTAARNIVDSYDEGGAGTLNLHVKTDSTNFFEGRLGAEISQLIITKNLTEMRPIFSASYGYDFAANKQKSTSSFIGQTTNFSSNGSKVAQGSLRLGTGVSFYTKKDVTLSLNYGFEHRSDYISHSGWLRIGYKF
ncbi:MAG: autotransporter domain-containing protein [Pseudomonadota bacterium]